MRQLALAATLLLAACNTGQDAAPERTDDIMSHPQGAGAGFYELYCAQCHGVRGLGQVGVTAQLDRPVPDLSVLSARNGGLFPVRRIMDEIYGFSGKFQPNEYHRGLTFEFSTLLEGSLVEWVAPDGSVEITPRGMLQLLLHLESFQVDALGPR